MDRNKSGARTDLSHCWHAEQSTAHGRTACLRDGRRESCIHHLVISVDISRPVAGGRVAAARTWFPGPPWPWRDLLMRLSPSLQCRHFVPRAPRVSLVLGHITSPSSHSLDRRLLPFIFPLLLLLLCPVGPCLAVPVPGPGEPHIIS